MEPLPPELLRLVLEDLKFEPRTLYALTLTSKGLRWEATRLLYRSMTAASGTTHFKFLSTIRRLPTGIILAPMVRVYHLPSIPQPGIQGQDPDCVWNLFLQSLPFMVNLKELAFHRIRGSPSKIFPFLGKGRQAPFQLDKFSWTWDAYESSNNQTYETQAVRFLETQHELTQLHWLSPSDVISTLSVHAFPKLKRLEGMANAINTILPSRLVTELHWLKPWYFYAGIAIQDKVMNSTGLQALRAISVESYNYFKHVLFTLDANHCDSLSNLEAVEVCILSEKDSSPTDLAAILSNFHRLKKLVISTPEWGAGYRTLYDPTPQISQIFAQCRHLKTVDSSLYPGPLTAYRRWVDGVLLPEPLSIDRDRILQLE